MVKNKLSFFIKKDLIVSQRRYFKVNGAIVHLSKYPIHLGYTISTNEINMTTLQQLEVFGSIIKKNFI